MQEVANFFNVSNVIIKRNIKSGNIKPIKTMSNEFVFLKSDLKDIKLSNYIQNKANKEVTKEWLYTEYIEGNKKIKTFKRRY